MKKEWTYKSTAKTKFGLTENQIQRAIEDGLVATKTVRNPHYTSAPPATLLRKRISRSIWPKLKLTRNSAKKRRRQGVSIQKGRSCEINSSSFVPDAKKKSEP